MLAQVRHNGYTSNLCQPFAPNAYRRPPNSIAPGDVPSNMSGIYNYYKKHGYKTQVMGASFRKVEQVLHLAGCDLLTISPDILETLQRTPGEVTPQLTVEAALASGEAKISLDEANFRWMHNQDAMAVEKLSEGIRKFYEDSRKLAEWIHSAQSV